jgi:uncharacterized BrkB/YihY/UPF0761 family membrane protein
MLSAYALYIAVSLGIVVWVGHTLYRNGAVFLRDVFEGEERANAVNKLLLVGFYLVSLGFVLLTSSLGTDAASAADRLQNLTVKLGAVALLLGVMHVMNLSALSRARQRRLMESRRLAAGNRPITPYATAPAPY